MLRKRRLYKHRRSGNGVINALLTLILIIGVLPIFFTTFLGRLRLEDMLTERPKAASDAIELQLPEIVAKQISIHMPKEAIKAQAVIARTQLMAAEKKGEAKPSGFSNIELQELWGADFESYYQNLKVLIAETSGETLQHNGDYIYAAFHQSSAGNTRNMSEYYEKSGMPYLVSADCHEDTTADGYLSVFFWTKEEFLSLCQNVFPDEVMSTGADIKIKKRDLAGYVLEVQIGQTIYEGERFRKMLKLPSACFEVTCIGEDVRIVCMGQGHGFGLSQHMAATLAEEGMNYQEILQYFYKGASILE